MSRISNPQNLEESKGLYFSKPFFNFECIKCRHSYEMQGMSIMDPRTYFCDACLEKFSKCKPKKCLTDRCERMAFGSDNFTECFWCLEFHREKNLTLVRSASAMERRVT